MSILADEELIRALLQFVAFEIILVRIGIIILCFAVSSYDYRGFYFRKELLS
jgi:hypothetical protein